MLVWCKDVASYILFHLFRAGSYEKQFQIWGREEEKERLEDIATKGKQEFRRDSEKYESKSVVRVLFDILRKIGEWGRNYGRYTRIMTDTWIDI